MSFITKLNNEIDKGLVALIFTHIRNYLICMTIIGAGFFAVESEYQLHGPLPYKSYGTIVIFIGIFLALFNLYDGIYRFSKRKFPALLNYLLIGFYIIFTLRMFEIVWHFRSAH